MFRRRVAEDLWIMRLRPEQPLSFEAGQYVAVGLEAGARLIERPYSIASAPGDPELEFFLERVAGGLLSPQLYEVPEGGQVWIRRQAKGRLLLDRQGGRRKHFLVATVTGVAPFLSMVRRLASPGGLPDDGPIRVALLHAAALVAELGYFEELSEYARRFDWFDYIPTISRPWLDPAWSGERGRAEDVARKYLDGLGFGPADTVVYLCGHPGMVANLKGILERAGFVRQAVREESYWPGEG